jgi:hypothetical protein
METAQGAKLGTGQWMDGGHPILKPMDVQAAVDEITLLPTQRTQFGRSQSGSHSPKREPRPNR